MCVWPKDFNEHHTCYLPRPAASMPLWRMLTGQLPGFAVHRELLLQVSAEVLPVSGGDEDGDGGSCSCEGGSEGGLAVGPLGPKPRLLSSPILR